MKHEPIRRILKNNLEVEIIIKEDNGHNLKKNQKWIYHSIEAYVNKNGENEKIAYLHLTYIDEDRKKIYLDNILQYAKMNLSTLGGIDIIEKYKSLNEVTENDSLEYIKKYIPHVLFKNPDIDHKKRLLNIKKYLEVIYLERYRSHLKYHYLKPEADYIHVEENYRRLGVGTALYEIGSEFLKEKGLNLYQSTTQSDNAKKTWEHFKKIFQVTAGIDSRYFINKIMQNIDKHGIVIENKKIKKNKNTMI